MGFYTLIKKDEMELLWNAYYNAENNKIDFELLKEIDKKVKEVNDDSYIDIDKTTYYIITHALYNMHLIDGRYQNIYLRFATNYQRMKNKTFW